MVIKAYFYCGSNYCNSSMVESLTVSSISFKSPFIKVIRSRDDLLALHFFHRPTLSCSLPCLAQNGVVSGSAPPYSEWCSSSSIYRESEIWILSELKSSPSSSPSAYFLVALSTWDLPSTSFLRLSANCSIFNLTSSFFCFIADLLDPTDKSEVVCLSTGQLPRTMAIASSIARYGRSYHFCGGCFHTMMEMQWKFALNSTYSYNCLRIVGESCGLQLITSWMLDSMRIYNILLSLTLWGSFVAQSEENFAASSSSGVIGWN